MNVIEKINKSHLSNEQIETMEKVFGKNTSERTLKQWAALVKAYGMELVTKTESMSEAQVKARMNETFSQRLHRQFKERR